MKELCILVLIVVGLSVCFAAVSIEAPNKDAAAQGKCLSPTVGEMKKGETKQIPNKCESARCNPDGSVSYTGCGVIQPPPGCKLAEIDLKKPHPECCKREFICN